jgi:hypothetical protein
MPKPDDGVDITMEPYAIKNPLSEVKKTSAWWDEGDTTGPFDFLMLPYLPYFSNCRGYDQSIPIAKLLETHPDCTLIPYDRTREVNQYPWYGMFTPLGDKCQAPVEDPKDEFGNTIFTGTMKGIELNCTFEEDVANPASNPRWYEADGGSVIFYLTKEPKPLSQFLEQRDSSGNLVNAWGRNEALTKLLGTYQMVPAEIGAVKSTSGYVNVIPRRVQLTITYFQVRFRFWPMFDSLRYCLSLKT